MSKKKIKNDDINTDSIDVKETKDINTFDDVLLSEDIDLGLVDDEGLIITTEEETLTVIIEDDEGLLEDEEFLLGGGIKKKKTQKNQDGEFDDEIEDFDSYFFQEE